MKKTMRILLVAVLLAAVLLCSSCAKVKVLIKVNTADNTGDAVEQSADVGDTPTAGGADTTPTAGQDTPDADTPATDAPAGDTPAGDTPATNAPAGDGSPLSTKEGVLAYYIECYNKIATEGKSAARTYDYTSNYKEILNIGGNTTIQGIANRLMGSFMKENTERLEAAVADVPPAGQNTCALTPDMLASATCTDKGDTYEIVLKSSATDDNPEINPGYDNSTAGRMGQLMETSAVTDAVGSLVSFEGLTMRYSDCQVTATVDKATGHITVIDYLFPSVLHFDKVTAAVFITVNDCDIGLLFHQIYEITY